MEHQNKNTPEARAHSKLERKSNKATNCKILSRTLFARCCFYAAEEMKSKEKSIWSLLWKPVFSSACAMFFSSFLLLFHSSIGEEKRTHNNEREIKQRLSMPFLFQLNKRNVLHSTVKMICRYFNKWDAHAYYSPAILDISVTFNLSVSSFAAHWNDQRILFVGFPKNQRKFHRFFLVGFAEYQSKKKK